MQRFAVLALALAAAVPAAAQQAAVTPDGAAQVRLLDGWRQADGSRIAAIVISLAPGWHTYWRLPGEAGVPPQFDWSGSRNLSGVSYRWPRPEVIEGYGLRSLGYDGSLTLPVVLDPDALGQPVTLALRLSFGICADICTREEVTLATELPAQAPRAAADPAEAASIEAALADRPLTPREAGVEQVTCALAPGEGGFEITTRVTFAGRPDPDQMAVIETGPDGGWIGLPESVTSGRTVIARAPIAAPRTASAAGGGAGLVFDRSDLRITLIDAQRAVEIRGCQAPD